jgi:hypothetical protein
LAREAQPSTDKKKDFEWDSEVKGFGLRMLNSGAKSWVLRYRTLGRVERMLTIGSFPDWGAKDARKEAARLKQLVDQGRDPMGERHEARGAPTVRDLASRYLTEHAPKKRTGSQDKATSLGATVVFTALVRSSRSSSKTSSRSAANSSTERAPTSA